MALVLAATTASTDYATAAQGALADSALQSIPDNYVLNTGDTMTGNLDVGGTVTADGLTASTSGNQVVLLDSTSGSTVLHMQTGSGSVSSYIRSGLGGSANLRFETTGNVVRQKIDGNGDISFYEDTGTTPKFFWDASAESLGIGTDSPSKRLHLYASSDAASVRLQNTANNKVWDITPARPGVANTGLSIHNVTDGRTDLHIDNSGQRRHWKHNA